MRFGRGRCFVTLVRTDKHRLVSERQDEAIKYLGLKLGFPLSLSCYASALRPSIAISDRALVIRIQINRIPSQINHSFKGGVKVNLQFLVPARVAFRCETHIVLL